MSATDMDGAGVKRVKVSIMRAVDSKFWDRLNWVAEETWLDTLKDDTWEYDCSAVRWTSGNQYVIRSKAIDKINNIEVPTEGITIYIDTELPDTNIEYPLDNSYLNKLDLISGNATDTGGAGVNHVEVSYICKSDSSYWDGTGWKEEVHWLSASGAEYWTHDCSDITWTSDVRYKIQARATDFAKNRMISYPMSTFMYDNKPPVQTFSINNDDEYTNLTAVRFFMKAEDTGSGVSQMAFSIDGTNWADWEPFNNKLWQRNYYERVIRNESELNAIRQYIINNPINWENDENNPRLLHEAYGI